jgi:hypothetical protein
MRTQLTSRVTRRRTLAGLAGLALPLGAMWAAAPANAHPAPGSPIEVFTDTTLSSTVSDAIQNGWWGHEGAPSNGTGTGTTFLDLDGSDLTALGNVFPDLGNIRVAFVPTSPTGTTEHPVASAGQTVDQVFGANSWFLDGGFGTSLSGNTNPNDSVAVISTGAEFDAWFQAGQPVQGFDNSLVLHDVTAPGTPVSTAPQGKSLLNRWPAGTSISMVFYESTGANSNGKPVVQVGADGHAMTAYMPFTTVAKPGDAVRTSAGYTNTAFGQPAVSTTTTLVATPASPQLVGTAVTLNATVAAASGTATGSVQFKEDGSNLGSPVAVDGTGHAVLAGQDLGAVGTHNLTAVYTHTGNFADSQSSQLAYQLTAVPVIPTHTAASATPGADASVAVHLTATVTADDATCPAGSVAFKEGGNTVGTDNTADASCGYSADPVLAAGGHTIIAVFTPTNTNAYGVSQSQGQVFSLAPPAGVSTDEQPIKVTVPAGTITITTPYTAADPLVLPDMALTGDLSELQSTATFSGIHLLDNRAGALPWTVSALASDLASGPNTINAQNVGLTNLVLDGATQLGTAPTTTDNPAAQPAVASGAAGSAGLGGTTPHTVLHGAAGPNDVQYKGTLTINAPTTTQAGTYEGVITFTAS